MKARLRTLLLGPVLLLPVFAPISAHAGTAAAKALYSSNALLYTAGVGEVNDVTISGAGGTYTVHDTAGVTAGTGCVQTDALTATCTNPGPGLQSVIVHTADQADTIHVGTDIPATLNAGPGNDSLYGGSESDLLIGGTGADVLSGGGGVDTADYRDRTNAIDVSIDGVANDGETGEGDNVLTDVEQIYAGAGSDTLRGSASSNYINGGDGDNTMSGLGGKDFLVAGYTNFGHNVISGGGGADTIYGGTGTDRLIGGGGNDYISSQGGTDVLSGGFGDDRLFSQDAVMDTDMCGPGADRATVDAIDAVAVDCETVLI